MKLPHLVLDNTAFLEQAEQLVGTLSAEQYTHRNPPLYDNGVGPHLRHCMDHAALFLQGLPTGEIDYDQRARRQDAQSDPQAMAA